MKKIIYLFLFISIIFYSCDPTCDTETCHYHIYIQNNSSNNIYQTVSDIYPDTLLKFYTDPNPKLDAINKTTINEKGTMSKLSCYEFDFKDTKRPLEKLIIYVFDAKTLESMSWDSIKAKDLYLKRYDLTLQDLQNNNWTITYP